MLETENVVVSLNQRFVVRDRENPLNVVMAGDEENCREYCLNSNNIMRANGEREVFECALVS